MAVKTKPIEYMYSNDTMAETETQKRINKVMATKEKLYKEKERKLEDFYNAQNKTRIESTPIKDRSWADTELLSKILKAENEDPKHYDNHPGEKRYRDTSTSSDFSKPHHNDPYVRYRESLKRLKEMYQEVLNHPNIKSVPGVYEKLGKIAEVMNRIEGAIDENGIINDTSITKAFRGYQKPKPCLLNKSIKKPRRADTNEYAVLGGEQYSRAELMEARDELNGILRKIDNF